MSSFIYLSLHQDAPTTAAVAQGQTVLFDAPSHVHELRIGGHVVPRDPQLMWWRWQVPRHVGRLWVFADEVPVLTIDIVASESFQETATTWYRWLNAIDPRLTQPSRFWQPAGVRRTDLEDAFAGASLRDIVHMVARVYDDTAAPPVEPWYGDLRRMPRLDRQGVHTSDGGWLVGAEAQQTPSPVLQRSLLQALALVRPLCDQTEATYCEHVTARVRHGDRVHTRGDLHLLSDWAHRILALVAPHEPGSVQSPQPDLALLYERWVWAHVLECVVGHTAFPDLMRTALDTATTARIAVNAHAWCGYQPRIEPQPHEELWSRDERVAIPDVVIVRPDPQRGWRALVFDAKWSMLHQYPTGHARNEVSTYLVRIGVGTGVPDWATLVHPGDQQAQYASGLHVYGTQSDSWDDIATTIQTWLRN